MDQAKLRFSEGDEVIEGFGMELMVTRGHWGHMELLFWATYSVQGCDEILPFNRYSLNACNEPGPGSAFLNKASRLTRHCMAWALATSPCDLIRLSFALNTSNTLVFFFF